MKHLYIYIRISGHISIYAYIQSISLESSASRLWNIFISLPTCSSAKKVQTRSPPLF